ncbi:hypothetical protein BV898_16293 [Hypsibius exemplaris]|uniref:Uncharacterized protein n=1 Tax=Hypsibius exemplaris TaxID=2072580 RepID=A0A9X6RLB8_HYPEX|nr:hypothetical protein BV898_16293 [Hypsibius exemplaris]
MPENDTTVAISSVALTTPPHQARTVDASPTQSPAPAAPHTHTHHPGTSGQQPAHPVPSALPEAAIGVVVVLGSAVR